MHDFNRLRYSLCCCTCRRVCSARRPQEKDGSERTTTRNDHSYSILLNNIRYGQIYADFCQTRGDPNRIAAKY